MRRLKWILVAAGTAVGLVVLIATVVNMKPEYAYMPSRDAVANPPLVSPSGAFDLWGTMVPGDHAKQLMATTDGHQILSPQNGAIQVDDHLLGVGRTAFYRETFGNEVFFTDVMGILDGPITLPNLTKAVMQLRGRGTTNLRVELAKSITIGGHTFAKGTLVDTGIDVPRGSFVPLGMPVKFEDGKFKIGISCAACHAAVHPVTGKVIEGAVNADLNAGLMMAMATNSAAYFTHTDVSDIKPFIKNRDRTVTTSTGQKAALPDPQALEAKVDATLIRWPRGNFDSTIDMKSNPAQIPDSFTLGDHPYGWSGFAAAGPFKGLTAFSNNVHAQNTDSLSQAGSSEPLFGMDQEVYLGTVLQNAANPKYRYHPETGEKPSHFFASVDPTPGVPGINELVKPPSYPKATLVAPDGFIASSPGFKFNEQNYGMAAWQNTLVPPKPPLFVDPATMKLGWSVFNRAGCATCHGGLALTDNKVIAAPEIGTEPSRAKALSKTEKIFGEPFLYAPDSPVPVGKGAQSLRVPTKNLDPEQVRMAFAHGKSAGGYKVPSLVGIYWSAPYLHDGGVAVGPDLTRDLGVAGTLGKGIQPDPANSLRALVDKDLRRQVVTANESSPDLKAVHVHGIGHNFWVDHATGFSEREQDALVKFLLSYDGRQALEKYQSARSR